MTPALLVSIGLGILLSALTFLFIMRIILTWYPQVSLKQFPLSWLAIATEPFLAPTRRLIPPLGGVDISPIIWVGIVTLLRELLVGQQGLVLLLFPAA
ncbi:YggT family protein [Candidatus Synechococcus calcipolaris G9]|uniref:YggT family protein n=1 Tax=Candidatus Synechococcus calcipolaris G9 TaxID=1497997 RepID=A0ABT6F002_9SYNE|nr:YggT family protein [Candidatus Synechococcus calcipolaris]MDG2991157.1 YggT family protein [Candidatus Synechococcus calcipolaris G9]